MTTMASQNTSLTVVYSTVYSDADQRKHQSSASLAFVWGIHRDRWIPRTKGQLRGKCFHLMTSSCSSVLLWFVSFFDLTHIPHLQFTFNGTTWIHGNLFYILNWIKHIKTSCIRWSNKWCTILSSRVRRANYRTSILLIYLNFPSLIERDWLLSYLESFCKKWLTEPASSFWHGVVIIHLWIYEIQLLIGTLIAMISNHIQQSGISEEIGICDR